MSDNPLFDGQGIDFHHLQAQQQLAAVRKLQAEQERQRRGVCPCPHCGGGIPRLGVAACMHCGRPLHWHGASCGATEAQARQVAAANAQRVANEKRRVEEVQKQRQKVADWETSADGRKAKSQAGVGCLGVLVGTGLVFSGLVLLFDLYTNAKETWSLTLLGIGMSATGVVIFRTAFSKIRSIRWGPTA